MTDVEKYSQPVVGCEGESSAGKSGESFAFFSSSEYTVAFGGGVCCVDGTDSVALGEFE